MQNFLVMKCRFKIKFEAYYNLTIAFPQIPDPPAPQKISHPLRLHNIPFPDPGPGFSL